MALLIVCCFFQLYFRCYVIVMTSLLASFLCSLKPRPDMQLVAGNKLHVWTGLKLQCLVFSNHRI